MDQIADINGGENIFLAQTTIKRWGNSNGIRLSKEILTQMNLKENDKINIRIHDGKMTIYKDTRPKYSNLAERLEAFYQKPIDDIYIEAAQEVDTGNPRGEEIW